MCWKGEHTWDETNDVEPPPELVAFLATWGLSQVMRDGEFWAALEKELSSEPA